VTGPPCDAAHDPSRLLRRPDRSTRRGHRPTGISPLTTRRARLCAIFLKIAQFVPIAQFFQSKSAEFPPCCRVSLTARPGLTPAIALQQPRLAGRVSAPETVVGELAVPQPFQRSPVLGPRKHTRSRGCLADAASIGNLAPACTSQYLWSYMMSVMAMVMMVLPGLATFGVLSGVAFFLWRQQAPNLRKCLKPRRARSFLARIEVFCRWFFGGLVYRRDS